MKDSLPLGRLSLALLIGAPLLGTSCPASAPRPPQLCKSADVQDLRFTDVSEEWGLRANLVDGFRLSTADYDGDGWADLAVSRGVGNGARDDFADSEVLRRRFLLRNTGSGGFEDVTESSGFAAVRTDASGGSDLTKGRAYSYALFADVDNDGDVDGVTMTETWEVDVDNPDTGDRTEVMLNNGDGTFSLADISTEPSELHETWLHSTSSTFLDADRDGRLDLFVGNQYGVFGVHSTAEQDHLYLGAEGYFRERTRDSGLEVGNGGSRSPANASDYTDQEGGNVSWATFGVLACDLDDDGDQDLVTQTYGRGLNQMWLNDGTGSYTNITAGSGWSRDDGDNYDTDQRFQCYCANEGAGAPDCVGVPSPLIGCSAGGWLPGWDDEIHRLAGNTFAAVCADLDNDGDADLATGEIRHWWTSGASDPSNIAWNDGGSPPTFSRRPLEDTGLAQGLTGNDWNEGDLTVGAFDFDNDGWLDLLRPQSDYPDTRMYLYRNRRDGTFADVAPEAGIDFPRAAGMAVADFDRDGDLDVATSFSRMRCDANCEYATPEVHLFRNDGAEQVNSLQLRLQGAGRGGTNRSGIGATVKVTAGGLTQVRELTGGNGHEGVQNTLLLHIGLRGECAAETVEVRWNDAAGTIQTFENLPANYETHLVEGQDEPVWPAWDGGE
ncbi:MAG: CRTAC1 family protein [Deltaproteobacteria bacterium]|nr:CRTAC1 family protein [Deltaproteobacteria bacterium]